MKQQNNRDDTSKLSDYGGKPFIVNLHQTACRNPNYRVALWTGDCLQLTVMSIPVGESIGLEMHENLDQFIRIESGCALVKMGKCQNALQEQQKIDHNYAILIPANTWHNIINIGKTPLKLYSIYAPVQHPFGTVEKTKEDAQKK